MNDFAPEILDFHAPRRPVDSVWAALQQWSESACLLLQEQWNEVLKNPVRFSLSKITPCTHKEISTAMTPGALGVHLKLTANRIPSIVVFSARSVLALLADLLDLPGESWPAERGLTSLETSMLEVLFERLAFCVGDSLPGSHSLPCRYVETILRPERTRILSPTVDYYLVQLQMDCRFGEDFAVWILPRTETDEQLETILDEGMAHTGQAPVLDVLAKRIPMEVIIELGSVELPMTTAMQLALGDVLILDHSIRRPILAVLEGAPKWTGMPVQMGPRQALQIREMISG